jgi:hypothetical protein
MNFDKLYGRCITLYSENIDNVFESIVDAYMSGITQSKLFTDKEIMDDIIHGYSDTVDYRKSKSAIQNNISNDINHILNGLREVPYDTTFRIYLEVNPKFKKAFKVGGYASKNGDLPSIMLHLILSNTKFKLDSLKHNIEYVIIHELVHARQVYQSYMNGEILSMPTMSTGNKLASIESISKYFSDYLLHPCELEAHAIEYNYRYGNRYTNETLLSFVKELIIDDDDEILDPKIGETVKSWMNKYSKILAKEIENPNNKWNNKI